MKTKDTEALRRQS